MTNYTQGTLWVFLFTQSYTIRVPHFLPSTTVQQITSGENDVEWNQLFKNLTHNVTVSTRVTPRIALNRTVEQKIARKCKQTESISRQCDHTVWLNSLYKYFIQYCPVVLLPVFFFFFLDHCFTHYFYYYYYYYTFCWKPKHFLGGLDRYKYYKRCNANDLLFFNGFSEILVGKLCRTENTTII